MSNVYDERSHPLLAQVPLTVSPFVSLPTATTLPYTYQSLPSSLPPSFTDPNHSSISTNNGAPDNGKPKFVVSSNGAASHPDDIIASCRALEAYLKQLQEDAESALKIWEDEIKERELAEKRRLAPGWLDREEKILQPEKTATSPAQDLITGVEEDLHDMDNARVMNPGDSVGAELDRAFGGLNMK